MKNSDYVSKEKQGYDPVKFTEEIKQDYHEDTTIPKANQRFLHETAGHREIFNKKVYVGVRGAPRIPVQNQLFSSDPDIVKWDKGSAEKNVEHEYKPTKTMVYNERDHHKLYSKGGNAKDYLEKSNDIHRASYTAHPAQRTTFNIFGY